MRQVLRRDPIYWEDSLVQSVFSTVTHALGRDPVNREDSLVP